MNRRSFLTKLAVGIVAAPAIVKALSREDPDLCVITPEMHKYTLHSTTWTVRLEPPDRSRKVLLLDWDDIEGANGLRIERKP